MQEPSRFEQAMFVTLIPALALPIVAGTLAFWVQPGPTDPRYVFDVGFLAIGVFLFVLLGSMSFNAWLLVRHPTNLRTKAVPAAPGRALLALYMTIGLGIIALFLAPASSGVYVVLAVATIVESFVVVILALEKPWMPIAGMDTMPLTPSARRGLRAYLVIAGAGVVYSATLIAGRPAEDTMGWWFPVLVALGLPWSPELITVGWVLMLFGMGSNLPTESLETALTAFYFIPVLVNVAVTVAVLSSPRPRSRALRIFFSWDAKNGSALS